MDGMVGGKHRVFILTDIDNEPDDTQSLVRLLLYSNVLDIEGLVATTSIHLQDRVAPETIRRVVDAYEKVQPNLNLHEPGFPTADSLRKLIGAGRPHYGLAAVGVGKDTRGSELLVRAIEKKDERPLWVCVWGGPNTLAQALHKLSDRHSGAALAKLISRIRVYTISDQDDSAHWIRRQFPDLFYIVSPGGYGAGTWGGIMSEIPGVDNTSISNQWLATHIQQGHGPLGACYPDVAYRMEGDTPTFLGLIPNGLNHMETPNWGGWGGRYELRVPALESTDPKGFTGGVPVPPETRPIWTNAVDTFSPRVHRPFGMAVGPMDKEFSGAGVTLWRWREAFQNDFAARMDWTIKPFSEANHNPVVVVKHADRLTVKSGEIFTLSAAGTTDPDGDSLSFLWFHYPEAGGYKTPLKTQGADNLYAVSYKAPEVSSPQTAHFILKVTDKGAPSLTRYKRVLVTFTP